MKLNQSLLAQAIRNGETKLQHEQRLRRDLKGKIARALTEGFWFCNSCELRTEREESEHGQSAHCERCGSPRIEWCAPVMTEDRVYLEPADLNEAADDGCLRAERKR